jgi:hypothetical protein
MLPNTNITTFRTSHSPSSLIYRRKNNSMSSLQSCLKIWCAMVVTGVLFGAEERILYAAPSAAGAQDGSSKENPMALQVALDATKKPIGAITIILADGSYRSVYTIPARTEADADKALTLRAVNKGKAIIDGSDVVTQWTGPDADGTWTTPWTEGWGLSRDRPSSGLMWAFKPIMVRRELIFVNGERQELVMQPDALAPTAASALKPGQFTVDEAAKVLRIKPPEGVDPKKALIEVSRRGTKAVKPDENMHNEKVMLMTALDVGNLTLDGIVFRRSAASIYGPPLWLGGQKRRVKDITVTDCKFIENNGTGWWQGMTDNLTVRRSEFSRNGSGGGGIVSTTNALFEDCRFDDNNWKYGTWGATWNAAGSKNIDGSIQNKRFKGRSEDLTFRRCSFQRNAAAGVWFDWGPKRIMVENCLIADNSNGVGFEIEQGPALIKDTVIRGNGGGVLHAVNSPDITFERCVLVDAINGKMSTPVAGPWKSDAIITVAGDTRNEDNIESDIHSQTDKKIEPGSYPPASHYRTKRLIIRDSIIQTTSENGRLFEARYWGAAAKIGFNPANEFAPTFKSERNRYFQLQPGNAFIVGGADETGVGKFALNYAPDTALAKIDPTSKLAPTSDAALAALNPLAGKPLEIPGLPLATDPERLALLKTSIKNALVNLRIPAQGGALSLAVRNPTTRDLTVNSSLLASDWVAQSESTVIAAGRVGTIKITLKPGVQNSLSSLKLTLSASATGVETVSLDGSVTVIKPGQSAQLDAVQVDAELSEWAKVPAQDINSTSQVFVGKGLLKNWGTPVDARAKLQAATDGKSLFLAITVQDDTRSVTPGALYEQDALEIFWDNRAPAARNGEHGFGTGQLIVTWPATDGPIPAKDWQVLHTQLHAEAIRSFAKRTTGGWVLELAIPLSEIGGQTSLAPGGSIALNLNLSDRDGDDANLATFKRLTLTGTGEGNASTADYLPFIVR